MSNHSINPAIIWNYTKNVTKIYTQKYKSKEKPKTSSYKILLNLSN